MVNISHALLATVLILSACDLRSRLNAPEPEIGAAVENSWWQPRADENLRWYWQLQDPIVTSHKVDVYDVDIDTPQAELDLLKSRGVKLICYFSVGTVELWRDDATLFPKDIVGERYDGYEDEQWLDISNIDALASVMRARLDRCAAKGFDGIEGDNVDAFYQENRSASGVVTGLGTSFGITRQQSADYVLWLARESHQRGLGFGLKNAEALVKDVIDQVDWMITENCFVDNWCEDAQLFVTANKPVFMAEYVELLPDFSSACISARAFGYSAIYRDTGLTAPGRFAECL